MTDHEKTLMECRTIVNNIMQNTAIIWQRRDKAQTQRLKELGIEFNIKLGQVNTETFRVLEDESWLQK